MRVLITGGTGLLGSSLAFRYREQGHQVRVLAREATEAEAVNAEELRQGGVELLLGSVTDEDLVARCCREVDTVHHIAAAMREANIPDEAFWETNVRATERLLDSSREQGVRRFVYCSSIGVYGKKPPKPADETTECRPEDIYQKTKKAAEELCLAYRERTGFPIAIVRPAEVYGPRDRRLLKLFRALGKGTFAMIGGGRNEHHLVYIDDMVQGFLLAAEKDEALGEIFVIAGDESPTSQALAEAVCRALGVRMPRWRIPLLPVWAAAWLVEAACKPLGLQPPIYPRRVDFFRSDFRFDISKARRVLGYRPETGLDEGVRKTLEWYRSQSLV